MKHEELTDNQAKEWIDEQIRKGSSVFCPFCRAINVAGDEENPCCRAFACAIQERSDAMFRSFANQYTAVEVGASSSITCPWCLAVNRAPGPKDPSEWKRPYVNPFCCEVFCHALAAHLEVKRVNALVHRADQIAEKYDKARSN